MSTAILGRPVFKQMRKGTKSCRECRRRKVKCTYAQVEDEICEPCVKYHRHCVKQGYTLAKNIKARVARAELAVAKLANEKVPVQDFQDFSFPSSSSSPSSLSRTSGNLASAISEGTSDGNEHLNRAFENNGFLKLFEIGPLVKPFETLSAPPDIQTTVSFQDPEMSDCAKLRSVISNEPLILEVLDHTSAWWTAWRDQLWALRDMAISQTLTNFVRSHLASDDAIEVGLGLMCLAQSLMMMRPGIDDHAIQLASPPRTLMDKILAVVDSVVLAEDKYAHRKELLLLYLLRGKVYSEDSQARKALMHIKKALKIAKAQRLGIMDQFTNDMKALHDQQQLLGGILEVDRFMCMVFGFPYTRDVNFSASLAFKVLDNPSSDTGLRTRALRRVSAVAAQQVVDRNTRDCTTSGIPSISAIAQMLSDAHSAMPQGWWDPDQTARMEDVANAFEALMTQLWYWTTRMFTFLPAVVDEEYERVQDSRSDFFSCMVAARSLIKVFITLRGTPSLSIQVCNCDDFMGVLAGCVLLVGWMKGMSSPLSSPSTDIRRTSFVCILHFEQDMDSIENLQEIFRYRAYEQGGSIAKQGLRVLETLVSFFENDEDRFDPISSGHGGIDTGTGSGETVAILLPYFGTIYVQLQKKVAKPQMSLDNRSAPGIEEPLPLSDPTMFESDMGSGANQMGNTLPCDDWNQFMFDAELDQDWNTSLTDERNPFNPGADMRLTSQT